MASWLLRSFLDGAVQFHVLTRDNTCDVFLVKTGLSLDQTVNIYIKYNDH